MVVVFGMVVIWMIMNLFAAALAEDRELGSYQISIPSMVSPANAQNAVLAGEFLNGNIVQPGEIFSYNQTVGERTAERGFIAGMISSRSKQAVYRIGGGVCTTASILHQAVKASELEVIERHNHVAPTSYLPQGEDAAIWYGVEDYRFRNNLENPVRLQSGVFNNALRISIIEILPDPEIIVNGKVIKGYEVLVEESDIYMVPVRPVVQALGGEVFWDQAVERVSIKYETSVVRLQISKNIATIDDRNIVLESSVILFNGNSMVPASFLSTVFNVDIETDMKNRTVISSNPDLLEFVEKLQPGGEMVFIPDPGLENAVRSALDKEKGFITTSDMENLTALYAAGKEISCLKGLEYASNLESMYLADNIIEDISPLVSLMPHFNELDLSRNKLSDLELFFDDAGRSLLESGSRLYVGGNDLEFELDRLNMLAAAGVIVNDSNQQNQNRLSFFHQSLGTKKSNIWNDYFFPLNSYRIQDEINDVIAW